MITENDTTETTITIGSGATFTMATSVHTTTTAVATELESIAGALGTITATRSSQSVNIVAAKGDSDSGESVPTITLTESIPGAPLGRVHFLGCKMSVTSNDQDYLGVNTAGSEDILRGVIMFPSGVIPGLYAGSDITAGAMPSAAFGTYASNKDQGDRKGHMVDGVFKFVLNGFTNTSNYSAHITGSMDPTSPIYFPNVLNTDPTKIQERGHYLYAHYDVPVGLAVEDSGATNNVYLTPGAHDHNSADFVTTGDYRPTFEIWREKFTHAYTPWIMSQKLGNAPKKLFKFHMFNMN